MLPVVVVAVELIGKILKTLQDSAEGKITPEEALTKMGRVKSQLDAVNDRVDAAADEKFGKKTSPEDDQ